MLLQHQKLTRLVILDAALEVLDETDPSGSNVTDADAIDADAAEF